MDINKVIDIIRSLKEDAPTMSVGTGANMALPPTHEPPGIPASKKKKGRKYMTGPGRKVWLDFLKGK
jgi:hypothetical protein